MIFKSFQIKNYKSFLDSGHCSVQDGVTIFAGKNESGKTNILSALAKINEEVPSFAKEEYSFENDDSPEILYHFEFSKDETQKLKEDFSNFKIPKTFCVTVKQGAKDIKCDYEMLETNEDDASQKDENDLIKYIKGTLPKFILYKTMTDELPDTFTAQDLSKKAIKRLSKYLDEDFSKIFTNKNHQAQQNLIKNLSRKISSDFSSKYKQKEVSIEFQINTSTISIYIQDANPVDRSTGYSFLLSQRSSGLSWYLNFYIALKGEELKPGDIILIDEPGMYLHPKAQQEMREILNGESKENQIIYSTHSPYLIDSDNLGQVKLVEKEGTSKFSGYNEESKIKERLHHSGCVDTMKPIVDAIGYSLGSELNLHHKKILICEGVSDYYYIKTLELILGKSLPCGITHANGCNNIGKIASLYLGLGISELFVLVDSDTAGKRERKSLLKTGMFDENHIFTTHGLDGDDNAIEDIFSHEWYLKNILEYDDTSINKADSKISKEIKSVNGGAKYIPAKRTYEIASKEKLNKDVVLNLHAIKLFDKLEKTLND